MTDPQPAGAGRVPGYYYLVLALLAFVVTAATIQNSLRQGRLAIHPWFDDVGYMAEAAQRLDLLWRKGAAPELQLYIHNPPHSPWSTVLGMLGFAIFGLHDWAAYAMNFWVVFGYLVFADYLLGTAKFWQKMICFAFLLSMPIIPESVAEFRPDHACSLATVIACMLLLEQSLTCASLRRLGLIGAMFGLAMLIKPSTFPAVIILMFACLVLSTAADLLGDQTPLVPQRVGRSWGMVVGVSIVVAALFFSVGLSEIVAYIRDNMFGQFRDVWRYKGNLKSKLLFDLTGMSGQAMLGDNLRLLLAMLVLGGVFSTIVSTRAEKARMTVLTFLLLGTFAMGFMNQMKSIFTGLTFQTCLVLMAVRVLAYVCAKVPAYWSGSLAGVCMVIAIANFQWPQAWGDRNGPLSTARRQMVDNIYGTLVAHQRPGHNRVLVQGIGDINPSLLSYLAIKNQHELVFDAPVDTDQMAPVMAKWDQFDFIVAGERGNQITANFNLQYKTLDELIAALKQRPDWREIGHYPFMSYGKGYYVFEKVSQ